MRKNTERLAWVVLLASFLTCVITAVAIPLGARAYVLYSQVGQSVTLEVQRAPLRVTLADRGAPVAVAETRAEIPGQTTIATDSTSGQLLMAVPRSGGTVVARAQIYDNTEMKLVSAESPRFRVSRLPNRVALQVNRGRVRIGVSPDSERTTVVEVTTPQGSAVLSEGSYEVKVTATTTEIAVRSGQALVSGGEAHSAQRVLSLGPAERAVVEEGQPVGPLAGARNLVSNGNFELPLGEAGGWSSYASQTDPNQPAPRVTVVTDQGRTAADFFRGGSNHAEVGIAQEINYDVRDFSFMELHMVLRIDSQDIAGYGGCGYLSSECPIIVAIDYKDIYGTDNEWRHAFYTGEPAPDWPLYPWTEPVPQATWQTYDSGNLMEEMTEAPPAILQRITVYASGHSFHALATEVELLVQE